MSLMPIKFTNKCLSCGHDWIDYQNTLDFKIKPCPKCDEIDVLGKYEECLKG